MKKILILIFFVAIFLLLLPQINALINSKHTLPPSTFIDQKNAIPCQDQKWSIRLGRIFSSEEGFAAQQLQDGGYIIIGTAYRTNGGIWLIKINVEGDIEWNKYIGGAYTTGKYVEETYDGGFIVVAEDIDGIIILKIDKNGKDIWRKVFPDGWMWGDRLIQQTNDNGFIIIGTTHDDEDNVKAWLIKTDENGNEEWNRKIGGREGENGGSVQQVNDGGYIFTGISRSYGINNEYKRSVWLVKTSSIGVEEWNKTFGEGYINRGFSIQQTDDNGFIIGGQNDEGALLIKTDNQGELQWMSSFGEYDCHVIYSVQQTNEGGYILTGTSRDGYFIGMDLYLIKVNEYGSVQWVKIFGEPNFCEYGNCVRQTSDGGYIITGTKQRFRVYAGIAPLFLDIWIIKTDMNGNYNIWE